MGNGTPIGRVRGLGSAHSGAHHWIVQRLTAVANLVLVLWFIASLLLLPNLDYGTVREWLMRPVPAIAMALLIVSSLWHAKLGMQVLIEDYVHEHGNKFAAILALNFAVIAAGAFGLLCVVRLALGAA
jgi:succinate dehydrogenase / fumarate reductase membrane anchor subunit